MPCSSRIALQERVEFGAFAAVEAGGRLVEAQQHRIGAHRAHDLEPALRAIGKRAGRIVGALGQADAVEPIARLVDCGGFGARVGARAEQAEHGEAGRQHQRVVLGDEEIFQKRHAGEQPHILKRARDPRLAGDAEFRHALEQERGAVRVGELQPADRRLVEAGDAVEQRGLAGAVRADQRGDLARAAQ